MLEVTLVAEESVTVFLEDTKKKKKTFLLPVSLCALLIYNSVTLVAELVCRIEGKQV